MNLRIPLNTGISFKPTDELLDSEGLIYFLIYISDL